MMTCPVATDNAEKILLGHGSGGLMTSRLLSTVFLPAFGASPDTLHDGACLSIGTEQLAFTTDSYVVDPLFFPGGDIGDLAVNGTVNDLAMCGAEPLYLSCGFILEEGFEIARLQQIVESMRKAAQKAGVSLVTGDTKVVERGKGDGVYINTSGVGQLQGICVGPQQIQPGDAILISGNVGQHSTAILSVREGLSFDAPIKSDTQELASLVRAMIKQDLPLHCMRDLTRGGLATVLVELASARGLKLEIDEQAVPVSAIVRGACEFLGLDPLYMACEGRMIAFVEQSASEQALEVMRAFDPQAAMIGQVTAETAGKVVATTCLGTRRILDQLAGDQLPRIC